MTTPELRVVGAIYRVLSEHDSVELQQAAERKDLPPNIRSALRSLAREAKRSEAQYGQKRLSSAAKRRTSKPAKKKASHKAQYRARVIGFFSDQARFPSKREMLEFLDSSGVRVPAGPKASRSSIASKIATRAESDPAFRKKLHSAIYKTSNGQTRGWLDLISGPE